MKIIDQEERLKDDDLELIESIEAIRMPINLENLCFDIESLIDKHRITIHVEEEKNPCPKISFQFTEDAIFLQQQIKGLQDELHNFISEHNIGEKDYDNYPYIKSLECQINYLNKLINSNGQIISEDLKPLGEFICQENKIVLYIKTIEEYAQNKDVDKKYPLITTLVHELFHAFYYNEAKDKVSQVPYLGQIHEIDEALTEFSMLTYFHFLSVTHPKLAKDIYKYAVMDVSLKKFSFGIVCCYGFGAYIHQQCQSISLKIIEKYIDLYYHMDREWKQRIKSFSKMFENYYSIFLSPGEEDALNILLHDILSISCTLSMRNSKCYSGTPFHKYNCSYVKKGSSRLVNGYYPLDIATERVKPIDLIKLNFKSTIENINSNYDFSSLTELSFSQGNTNISDFSGCPLLQEVRIPSNVEVEVGSFSRCNLLKNVVVDKILYSSGIAKTINNNAILVEATGNLILGLSEDAITSNVKCIESFAFAGRDNITSLTIPHTVSKVCDYAFSDCNVLGSVEINARCIRSDSFSGCENLKRVNIGPSVDQICGNPFTSCPNLEEIIVDPNNKTYYSYSKGNVIVEKATQKLVVGCFTSIIPAEVTSIGAFAFKKCFKLKEITIPSSVINIENRAFQDCKNLRKVEMPPLNKDFTEVFVGCDQLDAIISGRVFVYLRRGFWGTYALPETVDEIGEFAFKGCLSLEQITIPHSLTSIGDNTFANCTGLTSVTIAAGVQQIGRSAFAGCSSLTQMDIPSSVNTIGESAFANCRNLSTVTIPASIANIEQNTFSGCTFLNNIVIPDSVKSIGVSAFANCTGLTKVSIAHGVQHIDNNAFAGCSSLTQMDIPGSVNTIGESAFANCRNLSMVTIPASIANIEQNTFSGCTSLNNVVIPDSVKSIGVSAFANCSALSTITISNVSVSIADDAFIGCVKLDLCIGNKFFRLNVDYSGSYFIPPTIEKICPEAFAGCHLVKSVNIPKTVKKIGDRAFYNTSLQQVKIPRKLVPFLSERYRCEEFTRLFPSSDVEIIEYD